MTELQSLPESASIAQRQRYFVEQVQGKGRFELIDELVAEDFVNHTAAPGQSADREGVRFVCRSLHEAFSDFEAEVVHQVSDDEYVATYKFFRGVHSGEFMGVPPSGQHVEIPVHALLRYRDGLMVEHWAVTDPTGFLRQVGVLR